MKRVLQGQSEERTENPVSKSPNVDLRMFGASPKINELLQVDRIAVF
jgi:hypothetical protein